MTKCKEDTLGSYLSCISPITYITGEVGYIWVRVRVSPNVPYSRQAITLVTLAYEQELPNMTLTLENSYFIQSCFILKFKVKTSNYARFSSVKNFTFSEYFLVKFVNDALESAGLERGVLQLVTKSTELICTLAGNQVIEETTVQTVSEIVLYLVIVFITLIVIINVYGRLRWQQHREDHGTDADIGDVS